MRVIKVNGTNKNFANLCKQLEIYQHNLLPGLKEIGYSLTNNLNEIIGLVAWEKGVPVASVGIKKIDNFTCEVVRVFVCKEYRKLGIATNLLNKIELLAKDYGYSKLELSVWILATGAINLYKKLNYVFGEEKSSEYYCGYKYFDLYKNLK